MGLAGIAGNGQEEIGCLVAGITNPSSGTVTALTDRPLLRRYVPEDRCGTATSPTLSVQDNLLLRDCSDPALARRGLLDMARLRTLAENRVREFSIKTPSLSTTVKSLSGGNIQRVILARELAGPPDILVAHNPTAGLDLATTSFVHKQLREIASKDCAVLLISEELDELIELSDEIMVLHRGKLSRPLPASSATRKDIAAMMVGEAPGTADQPGPDPAEDATTPEP